MITIKNIFLRLKYGGIQDTAAFSFLMIVPYFTYEWVQFSKCFPVNIAAIPISRPVVQSGVKTVETPRLFMATTLGKATFVHEQKIYN